MQLIQTIITNTNSIVLLVEILHKILIKITMILMKALNGSYRILILKSYLDFVHDYNKVFIVSGIYNGAVTALPFHPYRHLYLNYGFVTI